MTLPDFDDDVDDCLEYPAVVSIDPGGTTGWSIVMVHPDSLTKPDIPILDNVLYREEGQFEEMMEIDQSKACMDLADVWEGAALVVEDFILLKFSMGRELLSPVRMAAHMEWHCVMEYEPVRPMFLQTANFVLEAISDDRLKRWKLWRRYPDLVDNGDHARDALRHSIHFLRRAKANPRLRATAWPHIFGTAEEPPHAIR